MQRVNIAMGETGRMELSFSEVCMHMRVAGKKMRFRLLKGECVQLLNADGSVFSAPILYCEAGLYRDGDQLYYYVPDNTEVAERFECVA